MPTPERFELTLQAGPSGVPATTRLRRLLKIAGRSLALRCVEIRRVGPATDDGTEARDAKPAGKPAIPPEC